MYICESGRRGQACEMARKRLTGAGCKAWAEHERGRMHMHTSEAGVIILVADLGNLHGLAAED